MLPPFVHDTHGWLGRETVLPFPQRRRDDTAAEDESAYAAPFAGALIGAGGAAILLLCWALWLPPAATAAIALFALAAMRGGRMESGAVRAADGASGRTGTGTAALMLLLLVKFAALQGLLVLNAGHAALALAAAVALGTTAAVAFRLTQPSYRDLAEDSTAAPKAASLQGLTIVALVVVVALLMPVYRIGPTVAALVASLGAFVAVIAAARRHRPEETADLAAAAGLAVEAAALVAVLAVSRFP
jgi:cobalamin synthase